MKYAAFPHLFNGLMTILFGPTIFFCSVAVTMALQYFPSAEQTDTRLNNASVKYQFLETQSMANESTAEMKHEILSDAKFLILIKLKLPNHSHDQSWDIHV